jgi:hypothetical protein
MFHGLVGSRSGQPPRLLVESSSTMNHPLPEAAQEAELSSIHKAAMGRAVSRSPKESCCSPA